MFETNYGIEKMAIQHGNDIRQSIEQQRRGRRCRKPGRKNRTILISLINGTLTFDGVEYSMGGRS